MRNTNISFDRLPAGSYFEARGKVWVKGPANMHQAGVSFNSYDAVATKAAVDFKKDPISVELFPGEMLVRYDPEEKRAPWSYEPKKTGE
jgi:hypothetical protein